ncbi:MAG: helix-turn-helix domain-containing protein [Sphingorhabdus sp.]
MQAAGGITSAQFVAPHPDLRRYVTTYYIAEVNSPDGQMVEDLLHPEWGSVRYICNGTVQGSVHPEPLKPVPPVTLVGHSSRATRIGCVSMRIASFGLLPLGWHHLVGLPASRFADQSVDAKMLKTRINFAALFPAISAAQTLKDVATVFDTMLLPSLMQMPEAAKSDDNLIHGLHTALLDSNFSSVTEIAERLNVTGIQLERLSKRVFGFPPKLLIRRQRFLRTLALLMRQPKAKWGEILDPQYYDQAHFNRDFQRFFGMAPKQYLALAKPIVSVAAMARMKALGDPLQGLHAPRGYT